MCIYCGNIYKDHSSELPNASDILGAGVLGTNQDLANFLTSGFWNESNTSARKFNLKNTGVNAKNGLLTYNTSGNNYDPDGINDERSLLVDESFKLLENTLGIDFEKTTNSNSDIRFSDSYNGAYAYTTHSSGNINYANINIPNSWNGYGNEFGNYTFQTILHEIGHALGLGHQGNYNGSASYLNNANFSNDSWQTSIMSYFSQSENTSVNASFAYLSTLSAVDLIALEDLYSPQGFSSSYAFAGDTTYGFNTNISNSKSQIFSELTDWISSTAFTISDGNGNDTLDFSGFSNNQVIDLRSTDKTSSSLFASSIAGLTGNLVISAGTIIENAVGGSGNDTIIGNSSNNTLNGGNGNDLLVGGFGDDIYIIDSISDTVNENLNQGKDLIIASVSYSLPNNIEKITLTGSLDIDATGNNLDNILKGNSGNNEINGKLGTDIVIFDGLYADYSFSLNNNNLLIEDDRLGSPNGTTTIENVEIIEFSDFTKTKIELLNSLSTITLSNYGASDLNYLDANLTQNIDALAVTILFGLISELNASYSSIEIKGLGNEDIIISDTSINTSLLNTLDGNTTGVIDASTLTTLTGQGADALKSFNSDGISGLNFDAANYIASYGDLISAFRSNTTAASSHYFASGVSEGRSFDSFDENRYLASHEDLIKAFGSNTNLALFHYIESGYREGRSKDLFDANSYLASNEDLLVTFGSNTSSAITHYINHGHLEERSLDSFNEFSYIASHADLHNIYGVNDGAAATAHYVTKGYAEGKAADNFDEYGYIASYSDLISAFSTDTFSAAKHYISFGKSEGRLTNLFNAESYLNNYPDLRNVFSNDLDSAKKHFIEYGFNEGRIV